MGSGFEVVESLGQVGKVVFRVEALSLGWAYVVNTSLSHSKGLFEAIAVSHHRLLAQQVVRLVDPKSTVEWLLIQSSFDSKATYSSDEGGILVNSMLVASLLRTLQVLTAKAELIERHIAYVIMSCVLEHVQHLRPLPQLHFHFVNPQLFIRNHCSVELQVLLSPKKALYFSLVSVLFVHNLVSFVNQVLRSLSDLAFLDLKLVPLLIQILPLLLHFNVVRGQDLLLLLKQSLLLLKVGLLDGQVPLLVLKLYLSHLNLPQQSFFWLFLKRLLLHLQSLLKIHNLSLSLLKLQLGHFGLVLPLRL